MFWFHGPVFYDEAAAYVAGRESSTETSVQSTHDVDIYASTLAGDYILIAAVVGAVVTVTPPTGYTELVSTEDALLGEYRIWYKLAVGGETTVQFSTSIAAVSAHLQWTIRNASIPQVANGNGTSAAPDPPSLTPSGGAAQYLWLAVEGFFGAVTQTVGPANYVNIRTEALVGALGGIGGAENQTIATVENPGAYTLSGSGVWRTSTLAFPVLLVTQTLTGALFTSTATFPTGTLTLSSTVTASGTTVTVTTGGTVTITGPGGVVYTGGTGTVVLPGGSYTWTSTDGASGAFTIAGASGGNRMGGSGAVRKPPRNVGR